MMETKTRTDLINEAIAQLEVEVAEMTEQWTTAKLNRDSIKIKETEERLVQLTSDLNLLKMRRPV